MAEWELDELSDLGHLLSASTDVIITDICEVVFLILTLDWVSLCKIVSVALKFDEATTDQCG